jgi:hypothetical protein
MLDKSDRVASGGELLFPPFTELSWDQHAPSLDSIDPEKISTFAHIARFGRPL